MIDNSILENLDNKISSLQESIINIQSLKKSHSTLTKEKYVTNEEIKLFTELDAIFQKASHDVREQAKNKFEKIVTDALKFVSKDPDIKFVIQENIIRGKPAYEFYIETLVDGQPVLQKPEDSCGGGYIDIISTTLKFAYLEIFNEPKIQNAALLLDEPAKMVSEQMSIQFAEYIKFLGQYFNKQIIMVTHNDNLSSTADKTFYVTKTNNGISSVKTINVNDMEITIDDLLQNINEEEPIDEA